MIIYKSTASEFKSCVDLNTITKKVMEGFVQCKGHNPQKSEINSWRVSLSFMERILRLSEIPDDCGVMIEYILRPSSMRVDFIISGCDACNSRNIVIVELKQWSEVGEASIDKHFKIQYARGWDEVPHPSDQAKKYKLYLSDMNESVFSGNIVPYSCAYLHNYVELDPEPLKSESYKEIITDTPIFFQDDVEKLQDFIKKYVGNGKGMDILFDLENGKIRPSRKFTDFVSELFNGNPSYNLMEKQYTAYEYILQYSLKSDGRKRTIIVNGGPGTGKSVVAMNALVSLLNEKKNVRFIAPNAAFKESIIDSLIKNKEKKKRIEAIITGSSSLFDSEPDIFDTIIVDEAHRLKKRGAYMYRGNSQVEDVIRSSQVNVFFVDDMQTIRPDDEGSVSRIKSVAEEYGSEVREIKLEAQFRCAGAEGFINWITHNLQIKDTANDLEWDDEDFDFRIFSDPNDMAQFVDEKGRDGHRARLLAGFAWKWIDGIANPDANLFDIVIPEYNFRRPWNSHRNQYSWPIDEEKKNQVGCIHTAQGMEFDYVGVIIGNDLKYDPEKHVLYADKSNYFDSTGKRGLKNDPEKLTMYVKNIYRVLLSRGIKGCYVFCCDENLRKYLNSRLKKR
jgi:Uncharacterized conserved protein